MTNDKSTQRRARRDAIAAGALQALAERGGHGLTHRAVDAALSLPAGSTSYYFNSRAALLVAAADALFAIDKAEIAGLLDVGGELDVDALLRAWTAPQARPRLLARLEFFLEASRNAEFRQHLSGQRAFFRAAAEAAMARRGEADPAAAADRAIARFEGELLAIAAFGAP